jgi:hypothetical protein
MSTSAEISQKFGKRREEVSREIQECVEKMMNIKNLKEVQVLMLSMRQRLLEDNHTLIEHASNVRKQFRSDKSAQLENISTNLQQRYQYTEKTVLIDGRTTEIKHMIDLIENQITFFNESIKTVDNVLFGIKTRVEIEKVLGI